MVKLIVLFHQIVAIVGYRVRCIFCAGLANDSGKLRQALHDAFFFIRKFRARSERRGDADAALLCLANDRADAGIGILNKGSGVAVKVNALFGVEDHILACVYFEQEVFEGAESYDARHFLLLFRRAVFKFAGRFDGGCGFVLHRGD